MSSFGLYFGAASAIIVLGQFVYYKYRVSRLQTQANNAAALEIAVKDRDDKILDLEANLKEKNVAAHEADVKEAGDITTVDGAIGFLRRAFPGGDGKKP